MTENPRPKKRKREKFEDEGSEEASETERKPKKKRSKSSKRHEQLLDKLTTIEESVDTMIEQATTIEQSADTLKEQVTNIEQSVDTLKEQVATLLLVNPKALLNQAQPRLVSSKEAVKKGTIATWTFVKDTDDKFWAIGSAHCGFFHRGRLVTLPKEVCRLGVENVYIHPDLRDETRFSNLCNDILVLELKSAVPNYKSSVVWDKNTVVPPPKASICGLSTSGYVVGDHLEEDTADGVYVFLEETGEPGHSGTLMFAVVERELKPFGVYYGTHSVKPGMRVRGIVVPLDFSKLVAVPTAEITAHFELTLQVKKNKQLVAEKIPISPHQYKGNKYIQYDDGEKYFGVLIQAPEVLLCGAMTSGNVLRNM